MAVSVTIGGKPVQILDYSVEEDSTPLEADDSTGSVGTITLTVHDYPGLWQAIDQRITLEDTERGVTLGRVVDVSRDDNSNTYTIDCVSRLGWLNRYRVKAKPKVGTFYDIVEYYLGLAGIASNWEMDVSLKDRWLLVPGWEGELWFNIKRLVIAQGAEIVLSNGTIVVREPRNTVAYADRGDIRRSLETSGRQLAESVEVYLYEAKELVNKPIYPPFGWVDREEIPSFSAGEVSEFDYELAAAVTSFTQPTHKKTVGKRDFSASVFSVVTDTGEAVDPVRFRKLGGIARFTLGEDSQSLHVWLRGPERYRDKESEIVTRFYLATGDPREDQESQKAAYPTLRILGNGIELKKEKLTFATGLTSEETDTEVGITIDSPFITSASIATRLGVSLARRYSTANLSLNGTLRTIQPVRQGSIDKQITWNEVESSYAGKTYAELVSGDTHFQSQAEIVRVFAELATNQMFGAAAGARIYDEKSNNWFRIRSAAISPDGIEFDRAEPDTINADIDDILGQYKYQEVLTANLGNTYSQVIIRGAEDISAGG